MTAPGVSPRPRRNIVTETSIPTNETTPEAVTAASEETTASTIPASELPEHPFARIG